MADHQPRLSAYIRSLVLDEHATKDILQETNVTLLKKARDFEPGTNFTAWAFRIAYFEVLTFRRKKGREKIHFDDDLVESIAESVERVSTSYEARLDALGKCIGELPDRQREVIERRYLQSESVQDIAADLGFKANAASQLLHRARINLLKCVTRQTTPQASSPTPFDS
ncbi:MAG: sigma-70 family RNA polymerase sigma factor [Verrucomicrobiales bacterium]|nr:sigma-70 family RNA polymerase sigma factor [Verrucomicrobiales bacterium]